MLGPYQIFPLLLLLLCLGCTRESEKDYIEYWSASNTFEVEFARDVVDLWNAEPGNRQVVFQPVPEGQSSEEVILAAIVGKTTPDVYSNAWPGAIEQYRDAEVILSFNQFSDFLEQLKLRLPEKLLPQFVSQDGNFYQYPWKGNPLMMAYNKTLLIDSLGCEPPQTYADYFEISKKLTSKMDHWQGKQLWMMDPNITPIWWQRYFDFYPFLVSASQGHTIISNDRTVLLNSPASKRVFEFFRVGYESGLLPISSFKEDIFLMGRLIFHITGPWSIAHNQKYASPDFKWGYSALPVYETGLLPYTYGDAKNIIIFSDTKYPEDCWAFVKFMTSREMDYKLLQITNQLPLRKDLLTDSLFVSYFEHNPDMRLFAEQIPYIVGLDRSLYLQEIFDMITKAWEALVIYRAEEIEEGLDNLNRQVQIQIDREKL